MSVAATDAEQLRLALLDLGFTEAPALVEADIEAQELEQEVREPEETMAALIDQAERARPAA